MCSVCFDLKLLDEVMYKCEPISNAVVSSKSQALYILTKSLV